jgi:hypothetical protein
MQFLRYRIIAMLGLTAGLIACAKTEDAGPVAQNSPATQPASVQANASTPAAPTASMLKIDRSQQWFPPARLHLTTKNGMVVARLYSDDPRDTLTGKEIVNSYDIEMELPDISDPSQITQTVWRNHSESMEMQDSHFGIFLPGQSEVLQPMDVTANFEQDGSHLKVRLSGTFALYKTTTFSDQMTHAMPQMVLVGGALDASVN